MIKIPKKTFEMHCENGDSACPEEGDEVSLDGLKGRVAKSDDTHVHVEPTEFHGEPVEADPETDGKQDDPTDENSDSKEKKQLLESLELDNEHN